MPHTRDTAHRYGLSHPQHPIGYWCFWLLDGLTPSWWGALKDSLWAQGLLAQDSTKCVGSPRSWTGIRWTKKGSKSIVRARWTFMYHRWHTHHCTLYFLFWWADLELWRLQPASSCVQGKHRAWGDGLSSLGLSRAGWCALQLAVLPAVLLQLPRDASGQAHGERITAV